MTNKQLISMLHLIIDLIKSSKDKNEAIKKICRYFDISD